MPSFATQLQAARARLGLTQEEAAQLANVPVRSYQGYERGENEPRQGRADSIRKALGITGNTKEQDVASDTALAAPGDRVEGLSAPARLVESLQQTVSLTLYTDVCAGDGVLVFDEASRISVELSPALAFHFLGFQPPEVMGVSQVAGDSMEPLLYDGDLVLYELTPDVNGGGVFVLNYDGLAACKRVQPHGRGYRLIPENRQAGYLPEVVRKTDDGFVHENGDEIEFGVVGRVLFPRPETPRLHIQQVRQLLTDLFRDAAFSAAA